MYLREGPTQTLAEVGEILAAKSAVRTVVTHNGAIELSLTGDDLVVRLNGDFEAPATREVVGALGDWLDVPAPFLRRIDTDLREHVLSHLLRDGQREVHVGIREDDGVAGITDFRDPHAKVFDPAEIVAAVGRVIDPAAPVLKWWRSNADFRLDVIVPDDFEVGIHGDRETTLRDGAREQVGDLTKAGVRVGQDVKRNLAPWVQPFAYRLWCTNGMEVRDDGLRIDARGATLEQVMVEFEHVADRAFKMAEDSIAAFYDLRSQPLDNPERVLVRIADEERIPDRTVSNLLDRIPTLTAPITMFDLVNLISNEANNPANGREGGRLVLQRAAGAVVAQHAERCSHCQSRLN